MVRMLKKGIKHIEPTEIKNEQLKKIRCSPFTTSETLFISPVTTKYSDVGITTSGSYTIVDGPGCDDNRSIEVDISNSHGISEAIKKCKSVKIVVLVS